MAFLMLCFESCALHCFSHNTRATTQAKMTGKTMFENGGGIVELNQFL